MSPYPRNLSEIKLDHIYIFTTSITLNERFSRKKPRQVFVFNNGNNRVKGRIVFSNKNTGPNKMILSFSEGDFQKSKKGKAQSSRLARRRRSVLMPSTKSENENHEENVNDESLKCYFSSYKPAVNDGRYKFVAERFYRPLYKKPKRADIFPSWCLPGKYRYTHQLPYKWKCKQVSKAQLDDEIDKYMAEVRLKPITITKDDDGMSTSTTEQYLRETEKYLRETEESEWPAL